ncbi:MAG: hypothetical protein LLG04_01125, partial [Parachlamydia sp.]|nr:hypothetical protein [Parachlamydia sp.]
LIYPLLAHADLYLGDTSSVGYDYLPFNRPMFFLNKFKKDPAKDPEAYLFRCGVDITPETYGELYKIIERHVPKDQERFSEVRRQVYAYTFGEERPFADIKADVEKTTQEAPSF